MTVDHTGQSTVIIFKCYTAYEKHDIPDTMPVHTLCKQTFTPLSQAAVLTQYAVSSSCWVSQMKKGPVPAVSYQIGGITVLHSALRSDFFYARTRYNILRAQFINKTHENDD